MSVVAMEISRNKKTGPCAATYAPLSSCPKDCPFLEKGCYAKYGPTGMITNRISKKQRSKKSVALEEAEKIRALPGVRPLRLHISGDCATKESAEIVAKAAEEYSSRYDQPVWTYTHAWKRVPRSAWGSVSVIASCETIEEARHARRRGYAAAMVSEITEDEKAEEFVLIPCFNQRNNAIKCDTCRFCFNDEHLRGCGFVVTFSAHGSCKKHVIEIVKNKNALSGRCDNVV